MASPERVAIASSSKKPIKLSSVGSTYQKRAGKPYKVKRTLKPGKRVSYTFGTGKGKRLTARFIFDNEAAKEAVLARNGDSVGCAGADPAHRR